ncbi:MAG: 2-dehydropantoate 2-reductase [Proteobacteria bacterium]|jgi:2-dehydropantoate 2-reductase|nr:2-dehydropantoate 2-reductase [Pseudomonadota bacterium]
MITAPRIAIIGAGLVGGYLGGCLCGHARVTLVCRERIAAALASNGLSVSGGTGPTRRVAPQDLDLAQDAAAATGADLVLVTAKSTATAGIAGALEPVLSPEALVVSFQNGMHNAERLRERLPRNTVLAGMVPFNVASPSPGTFRRGEFGELMVEESPALVPYAPVFAAAGVTLVRRADIVAVQWGKLLVNLVNPLNALGDLPLRTQLSDRTWRRCLALALAEALAVYRVAGIRPARITPMPMRWLPIVLELPDALFARAAKRMLSMDPQARASMSEDLRAGRLTEIDDLNGEVVALAQAHGMRAPVNARLVTLVHAAEQAPRSYTGREMLAELRAARDSAQER